MDGRNLFRLLLIALVSIQCVLGQDLNSADLPLEHRGFGNSLSYENVQPHYSNRPPQLPPQQGYGQGGNFGGNSLTPDSGYGGQDSNEQWLLPSPDRPKIQNIEVQCEKSSMRVSVSFDRPFYGMIFSKGHYSDQACVHMQSGSGSLNAQFEIYLNSCGMSASDGGSNYGQPNPAGSFVENTIIIQYDPLVQEVWDQARKLRCTWYDYYEKKVTFKPFQVDTLNAVTANFLGDNLQCWMQIQVGKGPWASEVSGIVKIGQTMTMVLAIKDDENKFDMLVRNCVAHDGKRAPIQLVDDNGCVSRPKVMSKFQKIKNFGSSASVVSYAYFQAFKFPDSMNVHFQCVIQVCRYQCPAPQCGGQGGPAYDVNPRNQPGDYQAAGSEVQESVATTDVSNDLVNTQGADSAAVRRPANGVNEDIKRTRPRPHRVHLAVRGNGLPPSLKNYTSVNRRGVAAPSAEYAVGAGQPRSIDFDDEDNGDQVGKGEEHKRRKRRATAALKTDVPTQRVIQVVAPGDLAFSIGSGNETVVVSESQIIARRSSNNVCMSVPGFVAGLIMLLLVLMVASIVSMFLFTRMRAINTASRKEVVFATKSGLEDSEFVRC